MKNIELHNRYSAIAEITGANWRCLSHRAIKSLVISAALLMAPWVSAGPIQLLLESDTNRQGGSEIYMAEFNSSAEFLGGSLNSGSYSQLNTQVSEFKSSTKNNITH